MTAEDLLQPHKLGHEGLDQIPAFFFNICLVRRRFQHSVVQLVLLSTVLENLLCYLPYILFTKHADGMNCIFLNIPKL